MKFALLVTIIMCVGSGLLAQEKTAEAKEAEYTRTINSRAQKIVATLGISDSAKFYQVQSIIASQYRNLSNLHSSRDEAIKMVKASELAQEQKETQVKEIESSAAKQIEVLHKDYLSKLQKTLSDEQVIKVKDGMTYNVLPITYKAFLDMILTLTSEEKQQIMTWLVEAREYAMDGESSDKKHWWFGKYKGKINNYLAARGYDLTKERNAWQERIKEQSEKKSASAN